MRVSRKGGVPGRNRQAKRKRLGVKLRRHFAVFAESLRRLHPHALLGLAGAGFAVGLMLGSAIDFFMGFPAPQRQAVAALPLPVPLPPLEVIEAGVAALPQEPASTPVEIEPPSDFAGLPPAVPSSLLRSEPLPEAAVTAALQARPTERPVSPAWQRNAVQLTSQPDGPAIALVIDDVGLNRPGTERSIALPEPLTLALMTYADSLPALAARVREAGHELMVHLPMQPIDTGQNAGTKALTVGLDQAQLLERLAWGLDRFQGYVGVNNHMGSRFTTDPEGMATLMAELKRRGLMFLDSKTVGNSLGVSAARGAGVPVVARDIFIDHKQEPAFITAQLRALEELARQRGYAIGIAHPHAMTLEALERWIPEARARGIAFVPISAVLDLQERSLAAHEAGNAG